MFQERRGTNAAGPGIRVEQPAEVAGGQADAAVDPHVRIHLRLGDADLGGLNLELTFGRLDIRSAQQQIALDADDDRRSLGRGIRTSRIFGSAGSGTVPSPSSGNKSRTGDSQKRTQLIVGLPQGDFQLRDEGPGVVQV